MVCRLKKKHSIFYDLELEMWGNRLKKTPKTQTKKPLSMIWTMGKDSQLTGPPRLKLLLDPLTKPFWLQIRLGLHSYRNRTNPREQDLSLMTLYENGGGIPK